MAAAVVAVLVLSAIPPTYAAIPVVRTEVGGKGGVGVSQPFEEGYTDLTATSSNSGVVEVSQVENPRGVW